MELVTAEFLLSLIASLVAALGAVGAYRVSVANAHKINSEAKERELSNKRINLQLYSISESTTHTKEQVKNTHSSNLREDIDHLLVNTQEMQRVLVELDKRTDAMDKDIRGIRRDIGRLSDADLRISGNATEEHRRIWNAIENITHRKEP